MVTGLVFGMSVLVFAMSAGYMWYLVKVAISDYMLPKSFVMAFRGLATGPLLLWWSWYLFGWPNWSSELGWYIGWAVTLNILLGYVTLKAFELNDLSLAVHLRVLGPAASLLVSYALLGSEGVPSLLGISGIFMVVVGVYFINSNSNEPGGWLRPIKQIWRERNTWLWLVLITTFIISFLIVFDKKLVLASNRLFAPAVTSLFGWGMAGLIWVFLDHRAVMRSLVKNNSVGLWSLLVQLAGVNIVTLVAHGYMYSYGFASSVGALRRLEAVGAVFFGWWLLGESGFKNRLIGTVLILVGALIIGLDMP